MLVKHNEDDDKINEAAKILQDVQVIQMSLRISLLNFIGRDLWLNGQEGKVGVHSVSNEDYDQKERLFEDTYR